MALKNTQTDNDTLDLSGGQMKLPAFFLIALALANTSENEIVTVFKRTEFVQKKFLQDTMKNRQEIESFEENEFVPAATKLISCLEKKECRDRKYLSSYLQALAFLDGSADETLTDQLKQIINKESELLANACTTLSRSTKKRLKTRFKDATHFLSLEKKVVQANIEKSILKCL